jgi:hypothetical protein
MIAQMIADWAARNGFIPSGEKTLKKKTDKAEISLEIKRSSLVVICLYANDRKPRIVTSLFKDIAFDHDSGDIRPSWLALAAS